MLDGRFSQKTSFLDTRKGENMFKWAKAVLSELIAIRKLLEEIRDATKVLGSTVNRNNHKGRPSITTGHWND